MVKTHFRQHVYARSSFLFFSIQTWRLFSDAGSHIGEVNREFLDKSNRFGHTIRPKHIRKTGTHIHVFISEVRPVNAAISLAKDVFTFCLPASVMLYDPMTEPEMNSKWRMRSFVVDGKSRIL